MTQTTTATKKAPRRRRRSPSELAADAVMRMPLGELTRFARIIVNREEDTARFILEQLRAEIMKAVPTSPDEHENRGNDLPFDKGPATDY